MSALVRALVEGARRLQTSGAVTSRPDGAPEPRGQTVLVTGVDRVVGAALAHDFHARGFAVHGTHQRPGVDADVPGMRWHVVPRPDDPAYLPTLHRIVQRHGVSIVVPSLDEELLVMAGVRRWPDPGVLVVVSGPGAVNLAQDKLLACWQLSGHAVPTPTCASPSDFQNTHEALDAMGGAAVVRARRAGRTGIGARVVLDPSELDWDRLDDDFIVQQFVPGQEYLCVLYRPDGPARRGTVVFEVVSPGPRHEEVRALLPGEAEDVERTAWAAIRALGILGPAEVVVRRAADNTPLVLSMHPRFSRHCSQLLDQLSTPETLPRPRTAPEQARGRVRRGGHHDPSRGHGPDPL